MRPDLVKVFDNDFSTNTLEGWQIVGLAPLPSPSISGGVVNFTNVKRYDGIQKSFATVPGMTYTVDLSLVIGTMDRIHVWTYPSNDANNSNRHNERVVRHLNRDREEDYQLDVGDIIGLDTKKYKYKDPTDYSPSFSFQFFRFRGTWFRKQRPLNHRRKLHKKAKAIRAQYKRYKKMYVEQKLDDSFEQVEEESINLRNP